MRYHRMTKLKFHLKLESSPWIEMLCLAFETWKLVRNFWHLPEFTDVYTHYHSEITSVKCNMDSGAFNQKRIEILIFYQTEVWINWTLWHLRLRIFYLFLMNSIFLVSRNTCLCMFIHVYICLYMFKQKPRISLYSKSLKFSKVSFYPEYDISRSVSPAHLSHKSRLLVSKLYYQ